jgi:hypothetical protein
MVKMGRDGRQAGMDRRDMLDILQLDPRTDCILPTDTACPRSGPATWLEQRHAEVRSMRLEISALEALGDDTAVVRGPGVCGRASYQDASPVNIAITPKPEAQ